MPTRRENQQFHRIGFCARLAGNDKNNWLFVTPFWRLDINFSLWVGGCNCNFWLYGISFEKEATSGLNFYMYTYSLVYPSPKLYKRPALPKLHGFWEALWENKHGKKGNMTAFPLLCNCLKASHHPVNTDCIAGEKANKKTFWDILMQIHFFVILILSLIC